MANAPPLADARIRDWIRPEIQALAAYAVPHGEGLIKLDAMESPYAWPGEALRDGWLAALAGIAINRYPDPEARALKAALMDWLAPPPGVGLLLGNGSDELIQSLLIAVAGPGRVVLAPEPTFAMYRLTAALLGIRWCGVPLVAPGFGLDLPAMRAAIEAERPAIVFLAYPNNPTGNLFDRAAVEEICAMAPGIVVLDEAYHPFADATGLDLVARFPHVVVLRTLSKMGLAGIRLGCLLGHPDWLAELDKVRLPYNINALTQATGLFALRHAEVLAGHVAQIRVGREILYTALQTLAGITVWPSATNFLLFRCPDAECAFAALQARGVLVRRLHGGHPLLDQCLRVSVGTAAENSRFLATLVYDLGAG